MAGALRKLFADFFSTIVFLAVYAATGDILIATGVAIAGAVVQFIRSRIRQEKLDIMTWASLGLVIVLGGATLLTKDPRFVLLKPAIGHFAIGTIMLRKDWMLRYSPPMVRETVSPHRDHRWLRLGRIHIRAGAGRDRRRHDGRRQVVGVLRCGDRRRCQDRGVRHHLDHLARRHHTETTRGGGRPADDLNSRVQIICATVR